MTRNRSQRPARRAQQLELVLTELRRDPHATVPELAHLLQNHGVGAHVRTVYRFRDEARALLPPTAPVNPSPGWPLTVAASKLSIGRARLQRMIAVVGMPAPHIDRATGVPRWPVEAWCALEGRFEAAVLRRPAVVDQLSPCHSYVDGLQLPPPAGRDGLGHWWLPADVDEWVRAGRSRRHSEVTWWTPEDLVTQLRLNPAAITHLAALPDYPGPSQRGRRDAAQVRAWVQGRPDWRDQVAGEATLNLQATVAYVGLSYATVRTYRTRGDWPSPDGWHGRTPRWAATTLQDWVLARSVRRYRSLTASPGGRIPG